MISCTVCGAQNDNLAVVCVACKSFLQTKVDNLNLFETLWGLLESPRGTFRRIALARHKNYSLLLSSFLGMGIIYTVFWYKNLGEKFSNLATLVGAGLIAGPFAGLLFVLVFSVLIHRIGRFLGGTGTFRNMHAVTAYASAPIVYAVIFVFPIEIAIFGTYFFGNNPPPLVINPVIYLVLIGFDLVAIVWSWVLLIEGTVVANGLSRGKAFRLTAVMMGMTALAAWGISLL